MMFDWFLNILGRNSKDTNIEQQNTNRYNDIFNPKNIKDSIIEYKNNHVGDNNFFINVNTSNEFTSNIEKVEILSRIKPIERLIEKHKYNSAIDMYKDLLEDYATKLLSNNELFYIFNGILNCYVNLNDKINIEKYIGKIEALGKVNEIYKFHFLRAIVYINQRKLDCALIEANKAIEYKTDCFKAICLKVVIEYEYNKMDIEIAKKKLLDENDNPIIGNNNNNDKAYIFNALGDMYFISRKYQEAIKYYRKSNELMSSPFQIMHIGIALFFDATKECKNGEVIAQKDIDYKRLRESNDILGELYNYEDEEIRNIIRKMISVLYIKSLYILRDMAKIDKIFDEVKGYCLDEREEIYRLKAISEVITGDISEGTLKELSEKDKTWIKTMKMMEEKKYSKVVREIEPFIWTMFKDEEKFHYILLEAYLNLSTDEASEKFERHIKQLKDLDKESEYIKFLKGLYYEYKGKIDKAEAIIKAVATNTSDFHIYFELIIFYERNKLEDKLEELFEKLLNSMPKIIEAEKNIFYKRYFSYLFRNNMIERAVYIYSNIEELDLNDSTYTYITAEIMSLIGDLKKSAIAFERHYELTKNLKSLFRSLIQYIGCNNIEKAEELVRLLFANNYPNQAILYAVYSNIEILKYNNIDKSYEYAKKALNIDKDNPNSDIHQFYVSRSIRCNKKEGTAYVPEYVSFFPRHNKWLKSFKAIEKDAEGNETLTQEVKEFLELTAKRFNDMCTLYSNRQIGISILAKVYGQTVHQILDWRCIYNLKATIYQGVIQEIYNEIKVFSNKIIIDTFSLYILAEIGYLDIIKELETVYVTYSTIEALQYSLLIKEDAKIRDILSFINKSLNIAIVYPNFKDLSKTDDRFLNFFFEDQLDSSIYSYSNNISYIYSDYFIKGVMNRYNKNFISLVAFFRALEEKSIINRETLSDILFKLKKNKYEFINFDSDDIFNVAKKSDFIVDDNIKLFFDIDKYSDIPSFAIVYVRFFKMIYGTIERYKFDAYVDLFIDLFNKYIKKTQYYFYVLGKRYPEFENEMDKLRKKNSLSSTIIFEELGLELFNKASMIRIANTFEFIKIKSILLGCEGALRLFLYMFKDNEQKYEYYCQKIRTQCYNMLPSEIELIIKQTKQFDLAKVIGEQQI
jgi:tetratricopeptide (TPR) repeat protein